MKLESTPAGLAIMEGPRCFVLPLPESVAPLEELAIRAALAVVVAAPESDGKVRAMELLAKGDGIAVRLAMRICTEFIGQRRG